MSPAGAPFLVEAERIGQALSHAATRYDGRCTWLVDELDPLDGYCRERARTAGADLAEGTAGIGWLLARLASIVGDGSLAEVALEAIRHALDRAGDLIAQGRLGLLQGATGVAWCAIDAGHAMNHGDLINEGRRIGLLAASAAGSREDGADADPGLLRGVAGTLAGLLALSDRTGDSAFLQAAAAPARTLVDLAPVQEMARSFVGLTQGASGVGLALAAWSTRTSDARALDAAAAALRSERAWYSPHLGWYGAAIHAGANDGLLARSWCSGAAGIGLARLGAWRALQRLCVAEAGAAIELIRAMPQPHPRDASICHGAAGEIELLLSAATTLSELAHLAAARRLGVRMLERAADTGSYGYGPGPDLYMPSLLKGLAGTALVLLRLADPRLAPMALLPPFALLSKKHAQRGA